MPGFKLEQFGGQLPAWSDRLIPAGQAASGQPGQSPSALLQNGYLFSGELRGWRQPKLLHTLNNSAAKFAYRVPTVTSAAAQANLVFLAQPNNGDSIVVGEATYTFVSALSTNPTVPYQVLIGASTFATAGNLLQAIISSATGSGAGSGVIYSVGTCLNPQVNPNVGANNVVSVAIGATTYTVLELVAFDIGTAFNSTLVSESTGGVRLSWISPLTSLANVVTTFTGGQNITYDPTITGASIWLEFLDPDTDVVRSQVVDDTFQRYYFASPSLPPQYNTYARIAAGQPAFLLGLNPPGCAPGLGVSGGGDSAQLGFPTSTFNSTGTPGANIVYLIPVTPSGAQSLNDIALMPAQTVPTANVTGVLYSDSGNNSPFELMAYGTPIAGVTAGTEATSIFTNPPPLLADVQYWIGYMTDTVFQVQAGDGNNFGVYEQNTYANGPPAFASNLFTGQPDLQVWADVSTGSILETRAYVYTWLSAYGEESQPSPYTLVNGWSNGTWTVDLFQPLPDDIGILRNITSINIYRTVTSTGGVATYFFVANVPVGTATYTDNSPDSTIALNNQLPSTTWNPPPEGLQGISTMPNGMMVGFRNNELWFCEPYQPHAWPSVYTLTTEFPIVGLGITGQAVVACTAGAPYVANGVNPSGMSAISCTAKQPCISKKGVISKSDGVYYPSQNGLIQVTGTAAVTNTTEAWITREKWDQLIPLKNLKAVGFLGQYFCFGTTNYNVSPPDTSVAQKGFIIDLSPTDSSSFTIWPQPGGHRMGFGGLSNPNGYNTDNLMVDPWSGVTLLLQNAGVYQYDFTDPAPTTVPYTWTSKLFQQESHKSYAAFRVFFDVPPGTPVQSAVRNTAPTGDASWNTLGAGQYGIIRVFADGNLVTTREIRNSGEIQRILSGFKADTWQFQFTGIVNITNVKVATSVKELGMV
jgi:hypothetical protein